MIITNSSPVFLGRRRERNNDKVVIMRKMFERSLRFILLMAALIGMGKSWAAAGGPWNSGVEASVMFDDNISRSQNSADIEEDVLAIAAADASYTWGFSDLMALTVL